MTQKHQVNLNLLSDSPHVAQVFHMLSVAMMLQLPTQKRWGLKAIVVVLSRER